MRSVQRSLEPPFLANVIVSYTDWDELQRNPYDRRRIREALRQDFGGICAYCQQSCQPTQPRIPTENEETPPPPDEESVDHFQPRRKYRSQQFEWLNLIYSCYRCNQEKCEKWPDLNDWMNQYLTVTYAPRFQHVDVYVNPNESDGQRPAHDFFDWDFDSGEILPSESIDDAEWSIAMRTIEDIDLNYERSEIAINDPDHIFNMRRYHLYLFLEQYDGIEDSSLIDQMIRDLREFGASFPFSGFIFAYLRTQFPALGQLFS